MVILAVAVFLGKKWYHNETMFPLRDPAPTRREPLVTYFLIGVNIVVFLLELLAADTEAFISQYGLVAANFKLTSLVTFQFLHGGFFHLLSNMWFLKIFGDNVEDEVGSVKFFLFYLFSGVIAGLSQLLFMGNSTIPMIGASGAVAGVMGAYFVFFPHHRIETLVLGPFFWYRIYLPAGFVLLYWFITQVFAGAGSLIYLTAAMGGVAFIAHAGGFLTGWILAKIRRDNLA